MDLSEKGWFSELLKNKQPETAKKVKDKNEYVYKSIQPSGLMYGHPILPKEYVNEDFLGLESSEKLKIVLLDGFIKTAVFPSDAVVPTNPDEYVSFIAKVIVEFYEDAYPDNQVKSKSFWGKKLSNEEIVENIINDRLNTTHTPSLGGGFFNNSLLFLDVLFFGEWLKHPEEKRGSLIEQRDLTHQKLLEVMIVASYADGKLDPEEKKLFNDLLESVHLTEPRKEYLQNLLTKGHSIEEIDLGDMNMWILRKYILELAILFIWADKIVTEEEQAFINKLGLKLDFSEGEIERSMAAIESFVVTNWGNVSFLQEKNDFNVISNQFIKRITKVVNENKNMISAEIKESKELMSLLAKSAKQDLTEEEQIVVRNQLIDILKILPTFVIIALPGSFLTLPLLMKIIPESALPSAFQKKK
ncbi:MAG: LETM1 domain-containing protein [Cyclobacteriaceae bacterium]|nr:LETM1 domain-containing protein [Cyclobacteriaceae bacterium]